MELLKNLNYLRTRVHPISLQHLKNNCTVLQIFSANQLSSLERLPLSMTQCVLMWDDWLGLLNRKGLNTENSKLEMHSQYFVERLVPISSDITKLRWWTLAEHLHFRSFVALRRRGLHLWRFSIYTIPFNTIQLHVQFVRRACVCPQLCEILSQTRSICTVRNVNFKDCRAQPKLVVDLR